jgi:hypothetical protein
VADPRVPVADLQALPRMVREDEAAIIGRLLVERIGRTPAGHRDVRAISDQVAQLPRVAWPAILPAVRRIAADPQRARDAEGLFALYAAGDADDAAALLALFGRNWPPLNLATTPSPSEEGRQMLWRESEARERRAAAYLRGLCALADTSPAVRTALIDASRASPPSRAYRSSSAIWDTMSAMGIDIERVAAERRLDALQREEIARIAREPRTTCPVRPRRASDGAGPNPYGLDYREADMRVVSLDLAILLALIGGATWAMIVIARRRRQPAGQGPPA